MSDSELVSQLRKARGQNYTRLFRIADVQIGDKARRDYLEMKARDGKVSWVNVGVLALRYDLPITTLFRMLEGAVVPTGTWELAQERGVTAGKILKAANGLVELRN